MTRFSAQWLALREATDHRARNVAVRSACTLHLAGRDSLHITDMGCGIARISAR